mgnify:FL=1|jgi:hypothetical protein
MSNDGRWTENERRARELFDASVEGLDGEMRSRLNRARQMAVAEVERSHRNPWRAWWPAAAAASVALLAVVLWRMPGEGVAPTAGTAEPAPAADVVELLATGEDLDVASEDPEFYTWLADRGLPETNGTG